MKQKYSIVECIDMLEQLRKSSSRTYSDVVVDRALMYNGSTTVLDYTRDAKATLRAILEGLSGLNGVVKDASQIIGQTLDIVEYMEERTLNKELSRHNIVAYLQQNMERLSAARKRLIFSDNETHDLVEDLSGQLNSYDSNSKADEGPSKDREIYEAPLTPRQVQIVRLLGEGVNISGIAKKLDVCIYSIRSQMYDIYHRLHDKIDHHNVTALATWYLKNQPMIAAKTKRPRIVRG